MGGTILPATVAYWRRLLESEGKPGPYTLYDPCCGGGYLLATLAFLHRRYIPRLYGSDIDSQALDLARRNLSLLSQQGLWARREELEDLLSRYGKPSHAEALESASSLQRQLEGFGKRGPPEVHLFAADGMNPANVAGNIEARSVEVVVTDLPYGRLSSWHVPEGCAGEETEPLASSLLEALLPILARPSVVALASDKSQKPEHEGYCRVGRLQIGKRRVTFLSPD